MPAPQITGEDLATIPDAHRRLIALWLVQVAESHTGGWVITPAQATIIRDVLNGAAVDLVEPLSEDTTIDHATAVLAHLIA